MPMYPRKKEPFGVAGPGAVSGMWLLGACLPAAHPWKPVPNSVVSGGELSAGGWSCVFRVSVLACS